MHNSTITETNLGRELREIRLARQAELSPCNPWLANDQSQRRTEDRAGNVYPLLSDLEQDSGDREAPTKDACNLRSAL